MNLENWRYEQAPAPEELSVNVPGVGVSGELMPQRPGHSAAIYRVFVEQGVEQRQQPVAETQGGPDNARSLRPPDTRVLVNASEGVMVPGEGIEGTQLMPAEAKLLLRVPDEPTNVRSDKGDPELVKLQHADDGEPQVVPV